MNISLPKGLEEFAKTKVQSGDYSSISEVAREGMRLLKKKDEQEQEERVRLDELKALIAVGVEQALAGHVKPFDLEAVKAKGREKLREA